MITDNMTGKVTTINTKLLKLLIKNTFVPVICPPILSEENEIINSDNDWISAIIAHAMNIKRMVVLFEAPGLLQTFGDNSSVVKHIPINKLHTYMTVAQGRMKKKILGAEEACRLGLKKLYWSDGRIRNPVQEALKGRGTIIS